MKYLKTLIIILLFANATFTQDYQGEVKYLKKYDWIKIMDKMPFLSKQEKEKMEYQRSSWDERKIYSLLYFTNTESKYIESDEKAERESGYSWSKEKYEIHKYFNTNTQKDIIEELGKVYIIEDSLKKINWKIKNNIKEIAGHICMNAIREDTIKMQKIEAWFALDLPVSGGPERNYGLPGLILEIDVNNGAMLVTAQSLTMKKLSEELSLPKKLKGKTINENAYLSLLDKTIKEKIKDEMNPFWFIKY